MTLHNSPNKDKTIAAKLIVVQYIAYYIAIATYKHNYIIME